MWLFTEELIKSRNTFFSEDFEDVVLTFKALEIFYRANGATVDVLSDRNGHRRKVVGEGENISWGGARTKGKGRECKLTKNMFLHSDLLKLCLKEKNKITDSFLNTTVLNNYKIHVSR